MLQTKTERRRQITITQLRYFEANTFWESLPQVTYEDFFAGKGLQNINKNIPPISVHAKKSYTVTVKQTFHKKVSFVFNT